MRKSFRVYLISFIITLSILALIAGIATADFNSRGVSGNFSDSSFVFSPTNSGLEITAFDTKYSIDFIGFFSSIKSGVMNIYNRILEIIKAIKN